MQSGSIKTAKATHEEGSGFSSDGLIILQDDGDFTPSSAYLPSLRQSSSYQSCLRSSSTTFTSRNNSLPSQRTDDYPILLLSRQTSCSRTLRSSICSSSTTTFSSASSLWSATSEEADIYWISILSNLHFCNYACKDKSFRKKLDWVQHEEQIHELPTIHTCLLHVSDTLSSDPCQARLCVSTMDANHLANFHSSFSCFNKPAVNIERYQIENSNLLLECLRERHSLDFENLPAYWSKESQRKTKWWCGFCRGVRKSWKERADHISLHFTRDGAKMEAWKDLSHIPFPFHTGICGTDKCIYGQRAHIRRANFVGPAPAVECRERESER